MEVSKDEKPKKILIFSTAYFPFVGGAEVAAKAITDLLAPLGGIGGFQFDMITARMNKKLPRFEKMGSVGVYRFGIGIPFVDKYLLALCGHRFAQELHDKNHYDVVWGIMASYGGFAASAFKKKNSSVPFLLTLQEGDLISFIKFRALPMWFAFKKIFKRADYIQAISNYLANWAKEMGAKCSIGIVPNGVDFKKFLISNFQFLNNDQILNFKKRLSIKPEDKIIITTSRLVKKNGVGDVIKAMSHLPENYKFLILGIGPSEIDLKLEIRSLKIENRVLMLGQISQDDILSYMAISDVFVRPSRSEGLGNSFLEAMAAGVPVIGTKVGGIPDFLKDGKTGLFCEVNNPKSIAEKIQFIFDPKNEELRKKIIANAKKLVQEKYNWNLIAEKMREIFKKIT